jgi:hypothetical protein
MLTLYCRNVYTCVTYHLKELRFVRVFGVQPAPPIKHRRPCAAARSKLRRQGIFARNDIEYLTMLCRRTRTLRNPTVPRNLLNFCSDTQLLQGVYINYRDTELEF